MDVLIPYLTFPFLGPLPTVLGWLSINTRFSEFAYGILSLPSIVYMLTFIAVFLFLTVRSIEKRRWSEG
jgi:ABC-2 type transport system permease protein